MGVYVHCVAELSCPFVFVCDGGEFFGDLNLGNVMHARSDVAVRARACAFS